MEESFYRELERDRDEIVEVVLKVKTSLRSIPDQRARNLGDELSLVEKDLSNLLSSSLPDLLSTKSDWKAQIGGIQARLQAVADVSMDMAEEFAAKADLLSHGDLETHHWFGLVSLFSYILPQRAREEWIGDLREARRELLEAKYPQWVVDCITFGRLILLAWSLLRVKFQDLVSSQSQRKQEK